MSTIYVLLPLALLSAAAWTFAFVWNVKSGQLDDLEGAAWRILGDDVPAAEPVTAIPDDRPAERD